MKKTRRLVLVLLLAALAASDVAAQPVQKLGAIGDSITEATNADDANLNILNFWLRLYADRRHSWSIGDLLSPSVRNRLAVGGNYVGHQVNGARWDDAAGQALGITSAGGVTFVTIEMGGNDVCRNLNDFLPSRSEIAAHIAATFAELATNLGPGATVFIMEVPDVPNLWTTTRLRSHVVFGNCQNLWDNVLFNFPCGYVLKSATNDRGETPPVRRALARIFNQEMNEEIAAAVAAWDWYNGVRFVLSSDTFEYQFTSAEVSRVDCFHPNRTGQGNFANLGWRGVGFDGAGYTPRVVHDVTWRPSGSQLRTRVYQSQAAPAEVYLFNCTDVDDPCYWGCRLADAPSGSVLNITTTVEDPLDQYAFYIAPFRSGEPPRYEDARVTLCR